jgi:D-arabinose 1-dehydrogenase-like Zn-dependent alcohol dehydrogenase
MGPRLIIVGSIRAYDSAQVRFTEYVARGEIWPLVSEIRPMEQAEELHELVENGKVTGRAALRIP